MEQRQVTIPLDEYEQMKSELQELRKKVAEKTITKYIWHPIWGAVVLAAMLIFATVLQKLLEP